MKDSIILILLIVSLVSCQETKIDKVYLENYHQWKSKRVEEVEQDWLTLQGLFWLNEGENKLGSDTLADIHFPDELPNSIGKVRLNMDSIYFRFDSLIKTDFPGSVLHIDDTLYKYVFEFKNWEWYFLKRGDRVAIRLKKYDDQKIESIGGLNYFDLKEEFILTAQYEPYEEDRFIKIDNIAGYTLETKIPGRLHFEYKNNSYSLDVMEGTEDQFFVIFSDATRDESTYGGGRYIYVDIPEEGNQTIIDFNKAYNPPCAFTEFATCPLPPKQNILPFPIEAGEKYTFKF